MLVRNQAPESEGSATPPEPQPTPSTSQLNISKPQTEPLQTETPPPVFHEHQSEAYIKQILQSPTTYQRKRKTQKHRRTNKDTKLPQTSVPQDLGADEAVHKEGVTVAVLGAKTPWGVLLLRLDNEPPTPHDSPLSGGNTPGSDEGRMELIKELMETCTSLTKRVLALEEAKTAQDRVINRLKLRVKRLEKKRKARTPQPIKRRLFKGRVFETSTKHTMAQTLIKMKEVKAKEKGLEFRNVEEAFLDLLAQIESDTELAQRLHEEELAELDRAQIERQRQKEATNVALTEEFDEIQARINADALFAAKL
ncbi:hypothetical protein Tco_0494696 [Tanacetum coccineum]